MAHMFEGRSGIMPEPRDVEQCEFMHVHEDIVAQV